MNIASSPAVLFDFGGTLDADGLAWKERVYRLFRDEGVAVARERFDPLFHAADDALVGTISPTTSFEATVGRLVAAVAEALGFEDRPPIARIARRFVDDALEHLDGNAPLLRRLARHARLGIVSNFYGNLARVCDDTGIRPFFSVLVDSTQVGFTKPAPRIFRHALDALGVGPADTTFVGDSLPRDMLGARGVGMRHIWLVGETAPAQDPCCPGDRVIHSLKDLEGLLE
jgi:HAD superfamily hydrolase (TIGR01549 family)